MKKGKCYCRIENPSSAYCHTWDCPKHGKSKLEGKAND